MRLPRIRHLRRALKNLSATRCRKLMAWADYVAANLAGTGTAQNFTVVAASIAATGTLTLTGNAGNGEHVVIKDKTYTFEDVLTNVDGHVKIGGSASASIDNLIAAITLGARQTTATGVLTLTGNAVDHAKAAGTLTLTGNAVDHAKGAGTLTLTGNAVGKASSGTLTLTGNILDGVKSTGVLTLTGNANDKIAATGILTLTGNAAQNEVVVIDGVTYEFTALANSPNDVLIGGTASESIDNLIAAIMHGAGEGTNYGTGTAVHPTVTAAAGAGDTMDVTAKTPGTGGNALATTTTMGSGAWGHAHLEGGLEAETVTIDATVYTFKSTLAAPFDVLIGASASDTIDNLVAAINLQAGEGLTYGVGTTAHPTVTALAGAGDTMDVTAIVVGTAGNVASTETMANGSFAGGTLTGGKNVETVTIGAVTYSFETSMVDSANHVKIGVSASATLDNLIAAIMHTAGEGATYGTGTVAHPTVTAVAGAGDTMDATAKVGGTGGDSIVTTAAADNGSWGAAALTGGVDLDTVTIDAQTYTFQDVLVDSPNYVLIGASASDTIDNLIAAITHAAGEGATYGTGTVVHPTVTAVAGAGDTMDVTAKDFGLAGNVATTSVMVNGSWGNVTLTGGLDYPTVTIGTRTYTLQGVLVDAADNVLIGASASDTIDNLIAAITAGVGVGATYGTGTTAHAVVTAAAGAGDTMDVEALVEGAAGNVASTTTIALGSFGAATLTGGLSYETVTIGATTYTFQGTLVNAANNVLIGASASETIDNLIAAIMVGAGVGVKYGTGTVVNASATAAVGAGDTMGLTAKTTGLAGSSVATTSTMPLGTFGGVTLLGGADLYALATTEHATVTAAAGAGDTMTATAKTAGLAGNTIATTTDMGFGSWGDVALTGGDNADRLDMAGHGYHNGDGPFLASSDTTLPGGLVGTTLYWTYAIDADHLSLHTTRDEALAGIHAVDILNAGVGTHSLTPAATAQAVIEYLRQGVSVARLQAATDVDDLI